MTVSTPSTESGIPTARPPLPPATTVRCSWQPYALSGALAVTATVSAAVSLLVPSVLTGAAVGNGNLRGTALIVLVLGVPVLVIAMLRTSRGSARWPIAWLGTLGYLLYQAVLFCFATPINALFLAYVAYLGLGVWSIVALVSAIDRQAFAARLLPGAPFRSIAAFTLVITAGNTVVWLTAIVPALLAADPASLLKDTGLLTNPVYVQDLAIWLPLFTVAGIACLRRRPWGYLVTGAALVMLSLEGVGVATDQWFGSRADPTSAAASMGMVPVLAGLAVVIGTVLALHLHAVQRVRGAQRKPRCGSRT